MEESRRKEAANAGKLVILTGPTAVGKTALSVALAKKNRGGGNHFRRFHAGLPGNGYRFRGKVTVEEMQGIPHFLIDEFDPAEEFHVVRFQEYARRYIREIQERGHIPILVGGTGFYIQSVLYDIDFTENGSDHSYREELETLGKGTRGRVFTYDALLQWYPRHQRRGFMRTMSNGSSGRWSFTGRPGSEFLSTMKKNAGRHRLISLHISCSMMQGIGFMRILTVASI